LRAVMRSSAEQNSSAMTATAILSTLHLRDLLPPHERDVRRTFEGRAP
jgi:hypothetical protein